MLVDAQKFAERASRQQRPRLLELRRHGAKIFFCKGKPTGVRHHGSHHAKAVVVNRRVAFTGNENVSKASRSNNGLLFRLQGNVVQQILAALAAWRDMGTSRQMGDAD